MTPDRSTFPSQTLLEHAGWVRALAKSLIPSDVHLAEDVAQDACLAALQRLDDGGRPLGGFFATVVRNLVRQNHRGSARRTAREARAAKTEALPSTLDLVERLSVHRAVVEAVMELDEPYRTTILLRFFEELSPAHIARRQGVPIATVKTRLARGLDRLRARLDREHGGDGRAWLLALVPLCKPSGGVSATTLGAFIVSTNIKIAIAGVVIACGVVALWPSHAIEAPALASAPKIDISLSAEQAKKSAQDESLNLDAPRDERKTALAKADVKKLAPALAPAPAGRVHGRVLDASARPQAFVRVFFSPGTKEISPREFNVPQAQLAADAPTATTDGSGGFELPAPTMPGEISASDARWTTVLSSCAAQDLPPPST